MEQKYIRNFSIIAHIDHGKSTLADRLMQECHALEARDMKDQLLDNMDIERERGITIKAQTVRLQYTAQDGCLYELNLIDTPGHVDFAYEVSRSLAACEGSLLIVDASQGVEAQTLANVYQALDVHHEILVVLNKIDLPAADVPGVLQQIEDVIGLETENAVCISAKSGLNIVNVLESIIMHIPPPCGKDENPLKALLVDSWYDSYLGVMILVCIKEGVLKKGSKLYFMQANISYPVDRVGIFTPKMEYVSQLCAGQIGFITTGMKTLLDCQVGDTLTQDARRADMPLAGFKPSVPVVFCGLFPVESADYENLKESLSKLRLNDASFEFQLENSPALGFGFRCGFLGLLHMEIIQERLEREFGLVLITTAPSVVYKICLMGGQNRELHNPVDMPDVSKIEYIEEPYVVAKIMTPDAYLGGVLKLCSEKRGEQMDLTYVGNRAMVVYRLPLNEIVFDFYDRLKSLSKGYASFDYEMSTYERSELVQVRILVNGESIDALSFIAHRSQAEGRGRHICARLKDLIPRQMFQIPIQAAIGGKIIARETISAMRKDVTAKCYGGDISRKRKLLEKQKEGKKKMRQFGRVEIPQSAFIAALKSE